MFDLYSIAPLLGFFFGLFAIIVIALKQKQPLYRKILLLLFLSSITFYCVPVYFVNSGKILNWPHFFRTGSPFLYLLSISLFLLGNAYLKNKISFSRIDYFLLSIPILHSIELIPFFTDSVDNKLLLINQFIEAKDKIYKVDTSFIPTFWHYLLQALMGLVSSAYILYYFIKYAISKNKNLFKSQLNWLFFMALFIFLFFSISLVAYVIYQPERLFFQQFTSIFFSIILLSVVVLFFLSPQFLYSIDTIENYQQKNSKSTSKTNLNEDLIKELKEQIDLFFNSNDNFLSSEFRLQNLADHLKVNKNLLSQVINSAYHQNFNQFINNKRIDFTLIKIRDKSWQNLSIEGMAESVGFKSRTTFNKAFKEKTGFTPSEYLAKQQH
jgi:AraC-like DNA-binding protein